MSTTPRLIHKNSPTPTSGTLISPVNGLFVGPDSQGFLDDVPPQFATAGEGPLKVVTAVGPSKLGVGNEVSPKTHG